LPYRHLDLIRSEYAVSAARIRTRLAEFAAVPREAWFYELAYCLLTPQSSAVNASHAVEQLQAARFIETGDDPTPVLRDRSWYIRFHNTKARRLREAREVFPLLQAELDQSRSQHDSLVTDGPVLRQWLLRHVRGLGWKESAHFLRNIGYRNLAILDRHILRNLSFHGVARSIPKSLTPGRYLSIEQKFIKFSSEIGIPMDELDLLFWSRETGEIRK
jgi:N-glycosylase/DNA lyase